QLREGVRRFVETRITPAVARAALDAEREELPPFWQALLEPGWLGLHRQGATLVEQAGVIEELGRACAPGPYVPRALAPATRAGDWPRHVEELAGGELAAAVGIDGDLVVGGAAADVIVCAVDGTWYALDAADVKCAET